MTTRFFGNAICSAVFVLSCIGPTHLLAQGRGGAAANAKLQEAAAKPTPRGADGHPDLNGSWEAPGSETPNAPDFDSNGVAQVGIGRGVPAPNLSRTLEEQLKPPVDPNPPPYKPELLAKVKTMALDEVHNDPAFHCKPLGVPRVGAPRQIIQTPKLTVLLYQVDAGIGDQPGSYRLVPTDGRPHRTDVDPSYFGDSVGHWEGDTLVVDVTHLNDETWLAGGDGGSGYFHSGALHVVERYTRKGNTLRWEATVEDPKVLTKAWVVTPQTEILTDSMVYEQPICEERETPHLVNTY